MIFCVFSDVHGNANALECMLKETGGSVQYIFLGDVAGYYYDQERCIRMLKKIDGLIAVRGNHDQYYLNAYNNLELTDKFASKYGFSYREKSEAVRDYLENLPLKKSLMIGGRKIWIQHGSPEDDLEGRIYPDTEVSEKCYPRTLILSGHTHYRMERIQGDTIWLNPGSLGQPRDGKGFSYCILEINEENGDVMVDWKQVKPDITDLLYQIDRKDPDHPYLKTILFREICD